MLSYCASFSIFTYSNCSFHNTICSIPIARRWAFNAFSIKPEKRWRTPISSTRHATTTDLIPFLPFLSLPTRPLPCLPSTTPLRPKHAPKHLHKPKANGRQQQEYHKCPQTASPITIPTRLIPATIVRDIPSATATHHRVAGPVIDNGCWVPPVLNVLGDVLGSLNGCDDGASRHHGDLVDLLHHLLDHLPVW